MAALLKNTEDEREFHHQRGHSHGTISHSATGGCNSASVSHEEESHYTALKSAAADPHKGCGFQEGDIGENAFVSQIFLVEKEGEGGQ